MSDEQIFQELVWHARSSPKTQLLQFRSLTSAHQYLSLYELVRRHVSRGARVLDWGAGNGHFSFFLTRAGYRTTAFSIKNDHIGNWLNRNEFTNVIGSSDEPIILPFEDASFDAVASIGVLEHVGDTGGSPRESLNEINRILAPGGRFICYHLPNRGSWIEALARLLPHRHHHLHIFSVREVRALLAATGFEPLEIDRYGLLPRNIWGKIPGAFSDRPAIARTWDYLDELLSCGFRFICQNHRVVARRIGDT